MIRAINNHKYKLLALFVICSSQGLTNSSLAQQTNNSSALTNQAAPSASSVTTGGTNINYQTNNTYQNEFGFSPGHFCRTPTIFVGGNYGENELDTFDAVTKSGNEANNFAANVGIVYPFGSRAIEACKHLADITVQDREISSQLSMIKACAALQRDGIQVDPDAFPLLEKCTVSLLTPTQSRQVPSKRNPGISRTPQVIKTRPVPIKKSLPPKIPQTTKS